ncbi:hypothetical protein DIPPA_27006 [Diplonema papillatum]|nr:hypothetical protein DIPPA_27006 [Diplonema papillatum]
MRARAASSAEVSGHLSRALAAALRAEDAEGVQRKVLELIRATYTCVVFRQSDALPCRPAACLHPGCGRRLRTAAQYAHFLRVHMRADTASALQNRPPLGLHVGPRYQANCYALGPLGRQTVTSTVLIIPPERRFNLRQQDEVSGYSGACS